MAQRKPSINVSSYFSQVGFLIYALLFVPGVSALVQSLFRSSHNHLLALVLLSYTHIPTSPPSLPLPEWNHSDHILLIHSLNKYVLGVYNKLHTRNHCLHDQLLCQLDILSQILSLIYLFTSTFYSPWTTVGAQ